MLDLDTFTARSSPGRQAFSGLSKQHLIQACLSKKLHLPSPSQSLFNHTHAVLIAVSSSLPASTLSVDCCAATALTSHPPAPFPPILFTQKCIRTPGWWQVVHKHLEEALLCMPNNPSPLPSEGPVPSSLCETRPYGFSQVQAFVTPRVLHAGQANICISGLVERSTACPCAVQAFSRSRPHCSSCLSESCCTADWWCYF